MKFDCNNGAVLARSLKEIERIVDFVESEADNSNGAGEFCDGLTLGETVALLNALKRSLNRATTLPFGRRPPRRPPALRVIEGGKQ
jgi:hypothetical protein